MIGGNALIFKLAKCRQLQEVTVHLQEVTVHLQEVTIHLQEVTTFTGSDCIFTGSDCTLYLFLSEALIFIT